jgi:hypothetical protein
MKIVFIPCINIVYSMVPPVKITNENIHMEEIKYTVSWTDYDSVKLLILCGTHFTYVVSSYKN